MIGKNKRTDGTLLFCPKLCRFVFYVLPVTYSSSACHKPLVNHYTLLGLEKRFADVHNLPVEWFDLKRPVNLGCSSRFHSLRLVWHQMNRPLSWTQNDLWKWCRPGRCMASSSCRNDSLSAGIQAKYDDNERKTAKWLDSEGTLVLCTLPQLSFSIAVCVIYYRMKYITAKD